MTTESGRAAGRASLEDFRVGAFLVRPRLNRVAEGGRVVQVQPKIMDVLVKLAARPGEVVTKEELFETVWAGTHVSEHVLSRAISELRKIFGDRPRKSLYIETIPKTGYRLVAPVRRADEPSITAAEGRTEEAPRPAASDAAESAFTNPRASRTNFRVGMAALSCATVIVVFVLLILFVTRDASHVHMHLHR